MIKQGQEGYGGVRAGTHTAEHSEILPVDQLEVV